MKRKVDVSLNPKCLCGLRKNAHTFTTAWPKGFRSATNLAPVCWEFKPIQPVQKMDENNRK